MARKNSNLVSSRTVINAREQEPSISAGQTVLSGLNDIDINRVDVFKNGIKLVEDDDYTVNSTSQITLTTALDDSDHISVMSIGHISFLNDTGSNLAIQDSGSTLATDATVLNFVGDGVVASGTGATKTITISGGGASAVADLTDVDVTGITQNELIKYDANIATYVPTSFVEDSNGNVGIGETNPSSKLDVDGTIQDDRGDVRSLNSPTFINLSSADYDLPANSSGQTFIINTAGSFEVNVNNADRAIGDIVTLVNNTSSAHTLNFDTYSNGVRMAGVDSDYSDATMTVIPFGMASLTYVSLSRLYVSGNVV